MGYLKREGDQLTITSLSMQGRRCILKDCCIIEDGAILPPETTVASFMKFTKQGTIEGGQGNPNHVPPGMQDLMTEFTKSYYEHFIPLPN